MRTGFDLFVSEPFSSLVESVARMPKISCLVDIDRDKIAMFVTVLKAAAAPARVIVGRLHIAELGKLAPALIVCDIDRLTVDPLEMLRQLRFVLPACIIVVYTQKVKRSWGLACHLAGASGLLSKASTQAQLAHGVRRALDSGAFTDPRFEAA